MRFAYRSLRDLCVLLVGTMTVLFFLLRLTGDPAIVLAGPDQFALQPIGTGPFVLERWDQRRKRAYAHANPNGWRRANFARLEFVELPNAAVRTQALLSRDVDIAPVEIEELDRLESRGYPIVDAPSMSVMSVVFITERTSAVPLQDLRVRQALNYAVDKKTIARTLLLGYGRASGQPAPSISFGHDPSLEPYPYDPPRARALLAEAGYPNGFAMTVEIVMNSFPADGLIYQSVALDRIDRLERVLAERTGLPLQDLRATDYGEGAAAEERSDATNALIARVLRIRLDPRASATPTGATA